MDQEDHRVYLAARAAWDLPGPQEKQVNRALWVHLVHEALKDLQENQEKMVKQEEQDKQVKQDSQDLWEPEDFLVLQDSQDSKD